jgi:hypothetical protein
LQFQKQSGGGGIDNNINDSICEVLEGGPKPTGAQRFRLLQQHAQHTAAEMQLLFGVAVTARTAVTQR